MICEFFRQQGMKISTGHRNHVRWILNNDLGNCIEKSTVTKVGCQPPWYRFKVQGAPFCENASMFKAYSTENYKTAWMYRRQLMEATKCLMPCSFMEYQVS